MDDRARELRESFDAQGAAGRDDDPSSTGRDDDPSSTAA
jgi:hypothetical protein